MSAIAVLAGALSVLLFFIGFLSLSTIDSRPRDSNGADYEDAAWSRLEEAKVKASRERSGTIVMPEVEVPDDWEPPPILPGDMSNDYVIQCVHEIVPGRRCRRYVRTWSPYGSVKCYQHDPLKMIRRR
jgi:hypothetical protein